MAARLGSLVATTIICTVRVTQIRLWIINRIMTCLLNREELARAMPSSDPTFSAKTPKQLVTYFQSLNSNYVINTKTLNQSAMVSECMRLLVGVIAIWVLKKTEWAPQCPQQMPEVNLGYGNTPKLVEEPKALLQASKERNLCRNCRKRKS